MWIRFSSFKCKPFFLLFPNQKNLKFVNLERINKSVHSFYKLSLMIRSKLHHTQWFSLWPDAIMWKKNDQMRTDFKSQVFLLCEMDSQIKTYYFYEKFSFEKISALLKQQENFSVHTKTDNTGTSFFILDKNLNQKVIVAYFAPHSSQKCRLLHLLELGK